MSNTLLVHEMQNLAIVSVIAIAVLGGADLLHRFTSTPTEITRKIAHIGCGFIVLSFPWVFVSHWTVLIIASAFTGLLYGTHKIGQLQGVHGVGRGIGGVGIYPTTAYLLFLIDQIIFHDSRTYYVAAVLVLALADAMAALVGKRIGRHRYEVHNGHCRSLEGSATFFSVAVVCTAIPLLTTSAPMLTILCAAIVVASITTLIEATSLYGLDNILVPIAAILILHSLQNAEPDRLILTATAAMMFSITGFAGLYRRPSPHPDSESAFALESAS